jgi:GNAT superfamily N-acetyltransferase
MEARGFLGFVYYEDGIPVGMCVGAASDYFFEPQYEIREFAILPAVQRQGAGTRMLAEIEAFLAARDIKLIYLHTSRGIPAYDFYFKNGYIPIEENVYFIKQI